jgi:glycosyltransferase involved in cell wall biosynthesis
MEPLSILNQDTAGTMLIRHLSTSASGGAAIAAQRICLAQRAVGLDAELVYRGTPASLDDLADFPEGNLLLDPRHRLASRAATHLNGWLARPHSILFTPLSASASVRRLRPVLERVHVVHMHNSYNFVSVRRIRESAPRAHIAVTMHDERLLTAGCHCTLGCEQFTSTCERCPQSRFTQIRYASRSDFRRFVLADLDVSLIAPSTWMREQVLKTGFPADRVSHIPNPIDADLFPVKSPADRRCEAPLTVGWLPGKAAGPFWAAIAHAQHELARVVPGASIQIQTTSDATVPAGLHVVRVSPPMTERERAQFWSSCDVGVSLTYADNFPNVVLESLCVGTPFIINAVGGSSEALQAAGGGIVLSEINAQILSHHLVSMATNPTSLVSQGVTAAAKVRELYSLESVGLRYRQHYEKAFQRRESQKRFD